MSAVLFVVTDKRYWQATRLASHCYTKHADFSRTEACFLLFLPGVVTGHKKLLWEGKSCIADEIEGGGNRYTYIASAR